MNSQMEYKNQSVITKSPFNQIVNSNNSGSYSCNSDQDSSSSLLPNTSSNIHINPLICGPRNIYVNKALYYNNPIIGINQSNKVQNKSERVYYNPKFFKNHANVPKTQLSSCQIMINNDLPRKQETNIYLNPHFIKKENFSVVHETNVITQNEIYKSNISNKSAYGSGIHFNPKFLKNCETKLPNDKKASSDKQTSQEIKECNSNISNSSYSLPRYISKYKIIGKKTNPVNINSSSLSKSNAKKINGPFGRRYKYKINREKLLSVNTSYTYVNKYSFKKYLGDKTLINSSKKFRKSIATAQKLVPKSKEIFNYDARLIRINLKKSILQQKIEARRKGKSFAIYGFRNYLSSSKYKYRKPDTPKSHYNKHHYHKTDKKINNGKIECDKSVFKTISKMKLVRKSMLQTQIESRRYARKSLLQLRYSKNVDSQISKYKIVHATSVSKKNSSSNKKIILRKNPMTFSSNIYRTEKLKRLHILTKKLRKNNQPCSFYNRYGRCKGKEKGSCPKVHDPKYVSICKKFLKSECKEEGCTLSHDIRPEKMPTCYHYLAGLCKRTNCPYLHIKVNQKAPICRAFLQGFCADVYNCNKRHEFICPAYAEKGSCLKGKSCSLPHRNPKTYSKLLKPDQFPILNNKSLKKYHQSEVSNTDKHLAFNETVIAKDNSSDNRVDLKKTEGKEFRRYFLTTLSVNESIENETINELLNTEDDISHNKCK